MASLGQLVVVLACDTARFQGDLGRAAAIAESRMRNIKDTAARSLGALTVAATAAGGAIVVALKQAADRADEMGKLAQASGVTVEQLSRLAYAADLSGVQTDTLGKALQKLAAAGAPDANAALLDLADRFAAMPDSAAKTALAIETFGERLGPGLVPLLNQGRAGLEALAKESDRLGVTISTKAARESETFNDSATRLKSVMTGLANTLLAEVGPGLAQYATLVATAATNTNSLTSSTSSLATLIRGTISFADRAATTFVTLGQTLGAAAAAAGAAARGDFSAAAQIIRERNAEAEEASRALEERLAALWGDGGPAVAGPAKAATALTPYVAAMRETTNEAARQRAMLERIAKDREEANATGAALSNTGYAETLRSDTFAPLIESAQRAAIELDTSLVPVADEAMNSISIYAQRAAENMQDAFADFLFDPFKGGLSGMVSSFATAMRRMVAEAASAEILRATGLTGFVGKVVGGVFGGFRAAGGPVAAGTSYWVGENGPELVTMGGNGHVTPNNKLGGLTVAPVYSIQIDSRSDRAQVAADVQRAIALSQRDLVAVLTRYNPGLRV